MNIKVILLWHIIYGYFQAEAPDKDQWKKASSIYEFTCKDIDGNDVSLEKYKYV